MIVANYAEYVEKLKAMPVREAWATFSTGSSKSLGLEGMITHDTPLGLLMSWIFGCSCPRMAT